MPDRRVSGKICEVCQDLWCAGCDAYDICGEPPGCCRHYDGGDFTVEYRDDGLIIIDEGEDGEDAE